MCLPQTYERSGFFTSCLQFVLSFKKYKQTNKQQQQQNTFLVGIKWYLVVSFIHISLMSRMFAPFHVIASHQCIFFQEICIQIFAQFLTGAFTIIIVEL